jgi:hypothetical protein
VWRLRSPLTINTATLPPARSRPFRVSRFNAFPRGRGGLFADLSSFPHFERDPRDPDIYSQAGGRVAQRIMPRYFWDTALGFYEPFF